MQPLTREKDHKHTVRVHGLRRAGTESHGNFFSPRLGSVAATVPGGSGQISTSLPGRLSALSTLLIGLRTQVILTPSFCGRSRPIKLSGRLYRPHTQGRQAWRFTSASGDQIPTGYQSQCRQGARPRRARHAARPRRRGDRMIGARKSPVLRPRVSRVPNNSPSPDKLARPRTRHHFSPQSLISGSTSMAR
jgi:hypothetical protein